MWQRYTRPAAMRSGNIQTRIVLVSWGCKFDFPIAPRSEAAARCVKGCLPQCRAAITLVPLSLQAARFTNQSGGEGCRLPKATQGTPTAGGAAVGPAGMQQGGEELPGTPQTPAIPPAVNFPLPPLPDLNHLLLLRPRLLQGF